MDNSNYIKLINSLVKTIEKDRLTNEQVAGLTTIVDQVSKSKTSILKMLPRNEAEQKELNSTYDLLESAGLIKTKKA